MSSEAPKQKNLNIITRNVVFGIQDGVVTTIGLLSGLLLNNTVVATSDVLRFVVLSILVSSTSMAIGSYQSERTADNFDPKLGRLQIFYGALTMFISYAIAGFLVLLPYFIMSVQKLGKWVIVASVLVSSLLLFVAGWVTADLANLEPKSKITAMAFETAGLGLVATLVGYISGRISIK